MADLVLNYMPEKMIDQHYEGHFKRNAYIDGAYEASRFVPTLGKEGRWVSFSGAPLKDETGHLIGAVEVLQDFTEKKAAAQHFDLMKKIARAEWDTLLFFYGVILCVGAGPVRLPGSRFTIVCTTTWVRRGPTSSWVFYPPW